MKCLQELKDTNISKIQNGMKKLKKEFKEDDYDTVISPFVSVMSNQIIP